MIEPKKILLQTTIPASEDDWSIARFGSLAALLRNARDESGRELYEVTSRDRDPPEKPDSVLSTIDRSDFDELWLFAVDTGNGLTEEDCAAISRFRRNGGGLLVTRGHPPLDPKSDEPDSQTDATRRFKRDEQAQSQLASTERLDSVRSSDFDGVFYPGGHGPLWDLAEDTQSKALIEQALADGKPVALVCHAPAVLKNVTAKDGSPLVAGKRVTGFTDEEEEAVGLTEVVPFLLEDVLKQLGAKFSKAEPFKPHVVREGLLITGQNPASSEPAAKALLEALTREAASADA